jgi:hypothetical protein
MKQEIPARVLAFERAATMVGGVSELARRLNVAERQLDYWMRDIDTPPDTMFFDVMNIIIENAGERVARNQAGLIQFAWPR